MHPQSPDYKSGVLLLNHLTIFVQQVGIEPTTLRDAPEGITGLLHAAHCSYWLRRRDLNPHISAYEADELPILYSAVSDRPTLANRSARKGKSMNNIRNRNNSNNVTSVWRRWSFSVRSKVLCSALPYYFILYYSTG